MKYSRMTKRLLAIILAVTMFVVNICPQTIYANDIENIVVAESVDDGVVLTTLPPNTSQDWAIAYKDGIGYPGFFHNEVEADIRNKNNGIHPNELKIGGAGRYGHDGKADIVKISEKITYIWEVKPASNGYYPKKIAAVDQVVKYVAASEFYQTGPNNVIPNSSFVVSVTSSTGRVTQYEVTYKNSLYNDGLIFYRFQRLGTVQEEPSTVTVPADEKDAAVTTVVDGNYGKKPGITVDWGKVAAFVAIAGTITAAGAAVGSDSVREALVAYSRTFLMKIGKAVAKGSVVVGGTAVGVFASAQAVAAAEKNPENADLQAINDAVDEYETALEVLLGVDSLDDLLDSVKGADAGEIEALIKGIQDENGEYEDATEAQPPRDPLIIDFGTAGIDLCSLTDGVNFDLDNNGYAEKTAWIGTEDGFLALDRNGNGIIDNGGELFGDQVDIGEGRLSSSGFEALSMLDDNGDALIDESDDCYDKLLVWVDSNHNGYSEAEELHPLGYYEIKEIQLNHTEGSVVDESTGTMMAEFAAVVYQNGAEATIGEFWFPVNASDTTHGDVITAGNVPGIEQAIADDETGGLLSMVNAFIDADSIAVKKYYVKKILYFITDSNDIDANSRGGNIDARDLHVIEQFMGREFNGVGGSNPNSNAAVILNNIYTDIENYYYNILNSYAEFGGYRTLMFTYEDENGDERLDVTSLVYVFDCFTEQGTDMETLIYDLGIYLKSYDKLHGTGYFADYCDYYKGMSDGISESVDAAMGGHTYIGTNGADCYSGGSGKNYIFGEEGDDSLYGGAGDDYISGSAGNDLYDGKAGNDFFEDDGGDDTYVFSKGYGVDTIMDAGGSNKLSFTNLTVDDIWVNGTGDYDVTIKIKGTKDSLVIKNFRESEALADYTLVFKDKTMHCTDAESPFKHICGGESDDVLQAAVDDSIMHAFGGNDTVTGSKGNDIIYGNGGNDSINAGAGNDVVYGGADDDMISGADGDDIIRGEAGCDTLDGGSGNDYLFGGLGDDTYVFAENYGRDIVEDCDGVSTIRLGGSLTMESVSVCRAGDEAVIHINGTEDMLVISGYGVRPENYFIESGDTRVSICDVITDSAGLALNDVKLTVGTEASDAIFAESVRNMIASGGQYDYIVGGEDEDAVFGGGDTDRILAGAGNDVIYGGEENDQLYGEDGNDLIAGGNGNDYINGGAGDDMILAGAGDDFIDGSAGNDTYYFNAGDGKDSIMDSEGSNTIMFGDGITSDGITAYRDNWNDLLITFEGLTDTLTIKNYCVDETARSFKLIFADGSVYAAADEDSALKVIHDQLGTEYMPSIYSNGITLISTNGDDELTGSDAADTLIGGDGSNRMTGNAGDDSLDGGAGRDYLYGGAGSDTYVYKKGYGTDTFSDSQGTNYIEISGYSASDVMAYRTNWNDITLVLDGSGEAGLNDDSADKIVLEGFFAAEANRQYYISFDGSGYQAAAENSPLRTIYGTVNSDYMQGFDNGGFTMYGGEGTDTLNGGNSKDVLYGGNGDDSLLGFAGNDTLNGGTGNDYLEGGDGDDVYMFFRGDGADTITDVEGANKISFGDVASTDVTFTYEAYGDSVKLVITLNETGDGITINNYYSDNFVLEFSDGVAGRAIVSEAGISFVNELELQN